MRACKLNIIVSQESNQRCVCKFGGVSEGELLPIASKIILALLVLEHSTFHEPCRRQDDESLAVMNVLIKRMPRSWWWIPTGLDDC